MSVKNLDRHNRWRNKTVAFRVSPDEDREIETAVRLSGLTKQDYITRRLLCRDVVVQGNPRAYKALRNALAAVLEELERIEAGKGVGGGVEGTADRCARGEAAGPAMGRQLRKHKTRLEKRLRQDACTRVIPQEEQSTFGPDVVEESKFEVVRTKKFPIKPMTVDEAILQMDLLGHTFFAFKNDDTGAFSVVYQRNDGGYGLIEDEG